MLNTNDLEQEVNKKMGKDELDSYAVITMRYTWRWEDKGWEFIKSSVEAEINDVSIWDILSVIATWVAQTIWELWKDEDESVAIWVKLIWMIWEELGKLGKQKE